ncbi:MAG: hypothetical protein WCL44_00830 [bacterium]
MNNNDSDVRRIHSDRAAWIIMACVLMLIIYVRLLPALLAGLFVYEFVNMLTRLIHLSRITGYRARIVAVAFIAICVVTLVSLTVLGLVAFFRSEAGSLPVLLTRMAEIVDDSRRFLPSWIKESMPSDTESMRIATVDWLKAHAAGLKTIGETAIRILAYILLGMIIGGMISLRRAGAPHDRGPLAHALAERVTRLGTAFHNVVFAQVRIAAINAFLTWLYLGVFLPFADVSLPFTKTLVVITFVAGMMPVVGNLVSNAFIVVVSLSYSLPVAVSSLVFLISIHKLEYFLNAKIVGSRIRAQAWEVLIAMLVMEVLFGIYGLIAAPIYYAYLKDELCARGLV